MAGERQRSHKEAVSKQANKAKQMIRSGVIQSPHGTRFTVRGQVTTLPLPIHPPFRLGRKWTSR
ncbi:hypothetical protein E2C01_076576 [Portunus trituberculatus]|uniref:Uncharacterized protein n=1 Tax=Portunus trituberculatus TaxID=210409 RepID=A0A5B7II42_PORTR|nr:hypothetical protein [Portunus trituberculatus]